MHLPGARAYGLTADDFSGTIITGAALLRGWSFTENTGSAPATVNLYDGGGTDGTLVASITLDQGQSTRDSLTGAGIECRVGLFVDVAVGAVDGAVWANAGEYFGGYVIVPGMAPYVSGE